MSIQFVYVHGVKGPEPQIWHEKPFKSVGMPIEPLQAIELPDAYGLLPISQLEKLYPCKGGPDVA